MKSPVARVLGVGNIKCRGKKTKTLSCLCCEMINFKWSERWKEAKKEISGNNTKEY